MRRITAKTTINVIHNDTVIAVPKLGIDVISSWMQKDVLAIVPDLEKSYGNFLVDKSNGKAYLDCFSYFASNPIGHNHPALDDEDFERRLLVAAKTKPSNSDLWTTEMAEFVNKFAEVAKPKEFKYLFFIDGGALAVENALKAAFDWKVRKNYPNLDLDSLEVMEHCYNVEGRLLEGQKILYFDKAFHGRSGYTMAITNPHDIRKTALFPTFSKQWIKVDCPKIHVENPITREKYVRKQILSHLERSAKDIAAIIIEPIQGEGGDNYFSLEFHQFLRRVTLNSDVLLIYDEVQTGLGATGKMWGYQHYGIVPDLVCFGKKTQVCGFMSTSRLDEVKNNVFQEKSRINSTWGGNLTDMVRSHKYLEVIQRDNLVDNAQKVGEYLLDRLLFLQETNKEIITNVRGLGLFAAMDLPDESKRNLFISNCFEEGLLLLSAGSRSVRLRPSLTFSHDLVDLLYIKLDKSIKKTFL